MTNEYCSSASSSFGHGFLCVEFDSDCDFDLPLFAVGVSQTLKRSLAYLQCEGIWRAESPASIQGQSKYPRLATLKKSNRARILRSLLSLVSCNVRSTWSMEMGPAFFFLLLLLGLGLGLGLELGFRLRRRWLWFWFWFWF